MQNDVSADPTAESLADELEANTRVWVEYLDALEAALRLIDEPLLSGRIPDASALQQLSPPQVPLPPRLRDRRTLMLALLEDLEARAISRREVLAGEMAAMPRRRASGVPDRPATLGGHLDVLS